MEWLEIGGKREGVRHGKITRIVYIHVRNCQRTKLMKSSTSHRH